MMLTPRAIAVEKDFRGGFPPEEGSPSVRRKAGGKRWGFLGCYHGTPPQKPSFLEVFMVNNLHFLGGQNLEFSWCWGLYGILEAVSFTIKPFVNIPEIYGCALLSVPMANESVQVVTIILGRGDNPKHNPGVLIFWDHATSIKSWESKGRKIFPNKFCGRKKKSLVTLMGLALDFFQVTMGTSHVPSRVSPKVAVGHDPARHHPWNGVLHGNGVE